MNKLRLFLLFVFVFLNTTAQNPNSQVIESLKIVSDSITNIKKEISREEFSKLGYQFIKKLDSIIKRNKNINNKN
mgnify:CR=1 FL=1